MFFYYNEHDITDNDATPRCIKISREHFSISENKTTLFLTIDYTLVAKVGNNFLVESERKNKSFSKEETEQFARDILIKNRKELESLGVDVDLEFRNFSPELEW